MTQEKIFGYLDGVYPTKDIDEIIIEKNLKLIESLGDIFVGRWDKKRFRNFIDTVKSKRPNSWKDLFLYLSKKWGHLNIDISTSLPRGYSERRGKEKLQIPYNAGRIRFVLNKIIGDYKVYGYSFKYFHFFSDSSYLNNINVHQIEPNLDTFETGKTGPDISEKVLANLLGVGMGLITSYRIRGSDITIMNNIPEIIQGGINVGWTKQHLIDALAKSELFYEEIVPIERQVTYYLIEYDNEGTEIPGEKVEKTFSRYLHRYPNLLKLGMNPDPEDYISFTHFDLNQKFSEDFSIPGNVSIRGESQYYLKMLPKYILEQLYILAYSPKLNLSILCEIPYMDKFVIRRLIQKYFRVQHDQLIFYPTKSEMCGFLESLRVMGTVLPEIHETSKALIFQPGGQTLRSYMTQPELYVGIQPPAPPSAYFEFYDRCADPNVDKSEIIFDAIQLGLIDKIDRNMTKEEICRIIQRFIRPLIK